MTENQPLQIPDVAMHDPKSVEILRVWVANRGQHVALRAGAWKDPAAWGIVLRDLMQHIANAYRQDQGLDPVKTLERIRQGFEAESASPTDLPKGCGM